MYGEKGIRAGNPPRAKMLQKVATRPPRVHRLDGTAGPPRGGAFEGNGPDGGPWLGRAAGRPSYTSVP